MGGNLKKLSETVGSWDIPAARNFTRARLELFVGIQCVCSAPLKLDTGQKQDKLCSRRSARWPEQEGILVLSSKER